MPHRWARRNLFAREWLTEHMRLERRARIVATTEPEDIMQRATLWSLLALSTAATGCGFNRDEGWLAEEVVSLGEAPPPIHGGTLLPVASGSAVIVGDPDRGRLVRADLSSGATREVVLGRALELGRMVEDGAGHVHVLARRAGVVIELDGGTLDERARREVCDAPRGLAWEEAGDRLHVACADGTLHTLGPSREHERTVWIGGDLRDVSAAPDTLLVSRFRSAELVRVRADGTVEGARVLPPRTLSSPASTELSQTYRPNTAIRVVPSGTDALVLHQRARTGAESVARAPASTYSYSSRPNSDGVLTWEDPCGNAVTHATVSVLRGDGSVVAGLPLTRAVTPVDLAVSRAGRVAVALAGDPGGRYSAGPQVISAVVDDMTRTNLHERACLPGEVHNRYPGQVISVAFAGETLVVQTREPSTLVVETRDGTRTIALGGERVDDTGHQLFHLDLGGTISCASCHPGGGDDGHVWTFMATGSIRTQSLEGVVGLPPYHRAGDVPSFEALLRRLEPQMDAPPLDDGRTEALERWLASLPVAPRQSPRDPALAAEGEALFAREGCADCHSGELGSDRQLHQVLETPAITAPLAGVAARAPYLRDGRATDLEQALVAHDLGVTADERAALEAYLESR
jgi:mono/diheme cytochrome c family protein